MWSYRIDDQITDSVPESKLNELIVSGQLRDDTPVLAQGKTTWENVAIAKLLIQGYELTPHPWYRFFARILDITIYGQFVSIILYIAELYMPSLIFFNSGIVSMILIQLIVICTWIVPETFLMAIFGTTLSKWICNIRVRNSSGNFLSFRESFDRVLGVVIKGLALGIPLLNYVAMYMSFEKLEKTGQTSWDKDGHFRVYHGKIGILRTIVILILVITYLLLKLLPVLLPAHFRIGL